MHWCLWRSLLDMSKPSQLVLDKLFLVGANVFKSDDLLVVLADRLGRLIMISQTTWTINHDWSKSTWTINHN
ncbi:UNC-50 family protein [Zea mays]|jgi:hypothetical protein|uniref:UNC-50 family protein n=1 Tax=Zea mays TaxID=4577 RepID=A0A1D6HZW4_MAIZE|nr:UNC-50 family protein [Zea mays]